MTRTRTATSGLRSCRRGGRKRRGTNTNGRSGCAPVLQPPTTTWARPWRGPAACRRRSSTSRRRCGSSRTLRMRSRISALPASSWMLPACLCPRLADLAFAVTVRVHKAASWTTPLAAIVILLAALAAYHGSFSGPLIYDDVPAIADNKPIRHLLTALSPPHGEGLTVEGRPVLNLSLAINYAISGTGVWSYHVLNLVIHVLAGWTLFGIVRRTLCRMRIRRGDLPPSGDGPSLPDTPDGGSTLFALGAALLWTVHPLQTEAVTYIIQRAESMMGLFYLLTLYCLIRGADAERSASGGPAPAGRPGIWYGLSVAACLLGMGTKEVMITAPVMMLFYDRTFAAGTFAGAWRSRRVYYLDRKSTRLNSSHLGISYAV